jgi:hypothetical protein
MLEVQYLSNPAEQGQRRTAMIQFKIGNMGGLDSQLGGNLALRQPKIGAPGTQNGPERLLAPRLAASVRRFDGNSTRARFVIEVCARLSRTSVTRFRSVASMRGHRAAFTSRRARLNEWFH